MDAVRVARAEKRLGAILSPRPWVLAVFRNGSTVAGTDQPDSDVDFTVVVAHASDRAKALKVLRRGFYRYRGIEHGTLLFRDRRPIDITVVDRPTVERWLRTLYRSPKSLLRLQNVVQHKIVDAVPVYDPQRLLIAYQRKARAYPERIRQAILSNTMESLDAALEDWGSRNEFHYAVELPTIVENVAQALYARNRRLLMFPFKRLHVDLKSLEPNLEVELYRLIRSGRSAKSRAEGRKVLNTVIRKLRAAT